MKTAARQPSRVPISAPVSQQYVLRQPKMKFASRKDGLVFSNTERFTQVGTSGSASTYVDALVPIMPSRLSYLSGIASNFGTYRWKALKFTYVTTTATTTIGQHGMAFIYDPADGPVTSLTQVAALQGSVLHPLWAGNQGYGRGTRSIGDICTSPDKSKYDVSCKYKSTSAFSALSLPDQLLFCPVWMLTATDGASLTSQIVGQIYVDYTVELSDPVPSAVQS